MKKLVMCSLIGFTSLLLSSCDAKKISAPELGYDICDEETITDLSFEIVVTKDEVKKTCVDIVSSGFEDYSAEDVMKEVYEYTYKESSFGTYLYSIDVLVPSESESEFVKLIHNGEESMVGISDLEYEDGDVIRFEIGSF